MENQLVISTPKIESPTEFHPFMRLPIEVRTQIWEELIPEIHDRIIWVREPGWIKVDAKRFTSILLRVSPESRNIYLTRFPMALNVCNCDLVRDEARIFKRDWHNRGVIYINPEHDVLAIGQPWQESDARDCKFCLTTTDFGVARGLDTVWTLEDISENPFTGDDFALLAQPLRRQKPRDRIRKLIDFPITMACHPGNWDVDRLEDDKDSDSDDSHDNDDGDGEPTENWDFNGVTKRREFTDTLDGEQMWEFHQDMEQLTGSELLHKWNSYFTVIDE